MLWPFVRSALLLAVPGLLVVLGLLAVLVPLPTAWCQVPSEQPTTPALPPSSDDKPATSPSSPRSPSSPGTQSSPHAQSSPAAEPTPGPLDTMLLRDRDGNLVPVLGMPFEEFEQLLRLKKGLAPAPAPEYLLPSLTLTGQADQDVANLEVRAKIVVRQEGWVAVPLRMPSAVLRQPAQYKGPGEMLVAIEPDQQGYVCWLRGKSEEPHEVTLQAAVPITALAGQHRLSLRLPRATESLLRLALPSKQVTATLVSGDGLVATSNHPQGTELRVLGAGGDLQLDWRQQSVARPDSLTLEATGEIVTRVEGRLRITSDARLRVRGLQGPIDRFVVRLPPGMELAPLPPTVGYTLALLGDQDNGEQAPPRPGVEAQRVEVRLERALPVTGEVWLRAQLRPGAVEAAWKPVQFIVEQAARQQGKIDFVSEGEWQLHTSNEESVHRIDVSSEQAAQGIVARYEYFQQPCDLSLTVAARPARLSIEPTHTVYVDAQRIRLESLLKCRFRGARADGLTLAMEGWTFERVSPESLFDVPMPNAQGQLFLPFRAGAAPPADVELKIEAQRRSEAGSLRFGLPRPAATNIAPATLVIFAADNLELTPQLGELSGLTPDATSIRVPGRQQPPLVYRDLGGGEPVVFAASVRALARLTTIAAHARASLEGQQLHIDQRLTYRVAHESQRLFELAAPAELWASGSLQVWMGDELLPLTAKDASPLDSSWVRLEFSAPTELIGSAQFSVRYVLPLRWNRQEPQPLVIPHVLPVTDSQSQLTIQEIEFALPDGVDIEAAADELDEIDAPSPVVGAAHAFRWTTPHPSSPWILRSAQEGRAAAISVSQLWAQTWFSPRIRQERVVLRIQTQRDSVLLRIDRAVKQSTVQTAIDGQAAGHSFRQPGVMVVGVPPAARGRECVLEIYYTVEPRQSALGVMHHAWRPIQIEDAEPPRRSYWQLALPGDEYLAVAPPEMTPEMAWSKEGWLSGRRSLLDQRQLEAWIKASPQEPLPRGANEYLFGDVGRWPDLEITLVGRRTLVLATSGLVLGLGMLLIHVPILRRPELGLVLGIALAGGLFLSSEIALLVAQASVLGLIIVLAFGIWSSWSARRVSPVLAPTKTVRRSADSPSTQPPMPRERSSRITSTSPAQAAILEVRP